MAWLRNAPASYAGVEEDRRGRARSARRIAAVTLFCTCPEAEADADEAAAGGEAGGDELGAGGDRVLRLGFGAALRVALASTCCSPSPAWRSTAASASFGWPPDREKVVAIHPWAGVGPRVGSDLHGWRTARKGRFRCGSGRRSARSGAFPPLLIPSLPFPSLPLERKEGEGGAAALEGEEAAGVWFGWLGDEAEERRAVVVGVAGEESGG